MNLNKAMANESYEEAVNLTHSSLISVNDLFSRLEKLDRALGSTNYHSDIKYVHEKSNRLFKRLLLLAEVLDLDASLEARNKWVDAHGTQITWKDGHNEHERVLRNHSSVRHDLEGTAGHARN